MTSESFPDSAPAMFQSQVTGADWSSDDVTTRLIERLQLAGLGGRIPSERELSVELDVSRTLLRDRLTLLESLGIISRRTGSGTYVQGLDPFRLGQALSVGLLLEDPTTSSLQSVRAALERQAAVEAARRLDHVAIAHMRIALDAMSTTRDSLALEHADIDFHAALFRASGNSSLVFFHSALQIALRRNFDERRKRRETIPNHFSLMVDIHSPVLDAIAAGDAARAATAMDDLFSRFDEAVAAADI